MATTVNPLAPDHKYNDSNNDNNDNNNNNKNNSKNSDIGGVVVEDLAEIRTCRTTRSGTLDLSQRKLEVIPEGLLQLTHVQCLYLQGNLLNDIPASLFENLQQLTWLDLRHNNLHQLPLQIALLKCLRNLLLEGNQIVKLPVELGLLTKLTGLNIKGNPLEFPPKNIVDQGVKTILKYLREQYLDDNLHNDEYVPLQDEDEKERHITDVLFDDDSTDEGRKNSVSFTEPPSRSIRKTTIQRKPILSTERQETFDSTLNIGKAKVNANRPNVPKQMMKSLSYPEIVTSRKNMTSTKPIPKPVLEERSSGLGRDPLISSTGKKKSSPPKKKSDQQLLNILRQTGAKVTELRNDERQNFSAVSHVEKTVKIPSSITMPRDNTLPPVNIVPRKPPTCQKQFKVGDMIAMDVPSEHRIPGQPCIGEVKTLRNNSQSNIADDALSVHFYTGTLTGPWVPMMSRNLPYLREVKRADVVDVFTFETGNCLPDDVIALFKK